MYSLLNLIKNNRRYSYIAYFLVCFLILCFPIGSVNLFDWDEINFSEAAREMLITKNFHTVTINFESFWEKPPLFIWIQSLSFYIFGVSEFSARLPNALLSIVYAATLYLVGKKEKNKTFGLILSLIFFTGMLPQIYFRSAIIDPIFNYFIFLSVYFFYKSLKKQSLYFAFLAGITSGLSVITKGPVGFLLFGLCYLVFFSLRKFKNFPKIYTILTFVIGLSSVILFWVAFQLYYNDLEMIKRFISYQVELFKQPVAGHNQPFFYHFVVVFIGCFPLSFFAIPNLFSKSNDTISFNNISQSLFWVVIILFSIVTTKILHYSSMTYLPLSYLAAIYIYNLYLSKKDVNKKLKVIYLTIILLFGSIFTVMPILLIHKEKWAYLVKDKFAYDQLVGADITLSYASSLIGVSFIALGIISFRYLKSKKWINFLLIKAFSITVTISFLMYLIAPEIEKISQRALIDFIKTFQNKKAYVAPYAIKSYAHLFYSNHTPNQIKSLNSLDTMLHGKIALPIYFFSRTNNNDLDNISNMQLLYEKGGYKFYKRTDIK